MHPLSMVEDEHFHAFVKAVDPRIALPCRKTLTRSLLPEMYAEAKAKLVTELSLANHISFIADCWTWLTNASYMTVTEHFINDQLKMVSRVLSTLVLEVSNTSENIAANLKSVIADWDVPEDKISGIVTDNTSNFKRAIANILKWKHIPCFAHTLSLAVKDAIHDNPEFYAILNKCRNIVTIFHHSGPATLKLNQLSSGRKSRLQQELPVRWNPTLIMIQSLLALQEPVTDTLKCTEFEHESSFSGFLSEFFAYRVELPGCSFEDRISFSESFVRRCRLCRKRVVVEMRNLTDANCQDGYDSVGKHFLNAISSDDIRALYDNRISQLNLNRSGRGRSASANYIIITSEYKKLPLLPSSKNTLKAWRSKQKDGILLPMIPVVKKYACIPATSVPSEQ
ncbi:Uncharacterized protein APZ42_032035 [Daphnia magna]|uniref:Uncharacterized protein n=1 Tax=Daphnia magna TaxID=35525 RepID=A0A164MBS5_9CRUS|nr:Uncharacterized protein APZ42_032035 [Daphnia magna]